jgi:hypothetical protein
MTSRLAAAGSRAAAVIALLSNLVVGVYWGSKSRFLSEAAPDSPDRIFA